MKLLLAISGLLAVTIATPAFAGSDDAEVAQCVVDNDMTDVKALLKTLPGSGEERRAGGRVMVYYGGCSDNTTAIGLIAWRERAEIARAALLDRFGEGRFDDARFDAAAPPRAQWALVVAAAAGGYDESLVAIRQYGDCIVGAAPGSALRLTRSTPGSTDEALAIAALKPAMSDCLTPGQNLRVKREELRLIVAEPLYHMISK